ncbi:metallophosphoesterase family protein [Pendulispora albinea]|uniref:Metallophosphoesterase n=1 Tax=Pendulispora albinea TaxID=2741071 RepID=A0ABZ2LSZ1_9BACT
MSEGRLLFAWLHLSDIHHSKSLGADSIDRELILTVLRRDAEDLLAKNRVPKPQVILVTGDIAATGDEPKLGQSADEYVVAARWLDQFAETFGLHRSDVLVVPGNHDVQRPQDLDHDVSRLINAVRQGAERLDDVLDQTADRAKIVMRQRNYLAFAASFGPTSTCREPDGLWWTATLAVGTRLLRLIGLNTALLARDDQDQGLLRLGGQQLAPLVVGTDAGQLTIALTHHPLAGSWLHDEEEALAWFKNNVHVHLSGHVHSPSSEDRRSGSGLGLVSVMAGAVHAGAPGAKSPRNHCYNFSALYELADGRLVLRVWHRRWSKPNAAFRTDVDHVGEDGFAEHAIQRVPNGWSKSMSAAKNDPRSFIYPDPMDLKAAAIGETAALVQAATGLRIELLFQGKRTVALWAKRVHGPVNEWKRLLLKVACLLAGDESVEQLSIGFADTSRLRNGTGEDDLLIERLIFPAAMVRRVAFEKRAAPDFWSNVTVEMFTMPVSPFEDPVSIPFPDYEARLR